MQLKNTTGKNGGMIQTDIFTKENIPMATKFEERCSISVVIEKIQTKTAVRRHSGRTRTGKAKSPDCAT